MRNMSFRLTTEQVRNETKTVTRRLGWWNVQPGEIVMACVQCQGLRRGQRVERIRPIRILSTQPEALLRITPEDVVREGFPDWSTADFIDFFCRANRCQADDVVNRIEFDYEVPLFGSVADILRAANKPNMLEGRRIRIYGNKD